MLGFDTQAGELVEGGRSPDLSIRCASFRTHASIGTAHWRIGLSTGLDRPVFATKDSERSLRWVWPQSPWVGLHLDVGPRFATSFEQGGGALASQARVSLPLGEAADLDLQGNLTRERGTLKIALAGTPAIPLAWNGQRTGGRLDLRVRPGSLGQLVGSLEQEEDAPLPDEGGTLLEGTSTATGWGLRWEPASNGPWWNASGRHAAVRTEGVVDSGGHHRTFHDAELRSWQRSVSLGWVSPSWRGGLHGDHLVGASPMSSYFAPFLSWNALDPSSWAAVRQILSDQREFVHGTAELRRAAISLQRRAVLGPLELWGGGNVGWWGIDAETVLRTTRMNLFGLGYEVKSDTLIGPRLRVWTLEPQMRAGLRLSSVGELVLQGRATVPLSVRQLGPRPQPQGQSGTQGEDPRGLWDAAISWRRAW